nr:PREDICTED: myeloid-associated differentiation marker-like [Bos mutus]
MSTGRQRCFVLNSGFLDNQSLRECLLPDLGLLSCIMCVLYAIDMAYMWKHYKLKNIPCYVHTLPGLLKILESAVACVIFVFISNTSLYLHQPALEWCVAVYSICFVQVVVAMLLKLRGWEKRLPLRLPTFHRVGTWFSFLLYVIAMVLWPLYQFNEKLGGQPHWYRDMSCVDELTNYGCVWDQQLAVAILTAINLVIYVADLVYWTRQVSVGGIDQLPPVNHEAWTARPSAHITGPLGLPIRLLIELVELTEDQSTRVEEHREYRLLRQDTERFNGIENSSHEGECSGSDDPVLGRAWRQELDVGGAEDDGL